MGDISTDRGRKRAHIKLLPLEAIAREALCAVLGRLFELPIPQPYYVNVDPDYVKVVPGVTNKLPGNIYNMAFALESEPFLAARLTDDTQLTSELLKWSELLRCAAFDTWVGNRDRLPNNLLYKGSAHFLMIDHEDALPGYLSDSIPIGSQLIELAARGKSEHELYRLRDRLVGFVDAYRSIDWDEIRAFVQYNEFPDGELYFERHIAFLAKRTRHMRKILTEELGIRQRDFVFLSGSDNADDLVR